MAKTGKRLRKARENFLGKVDLELEDAVQLIKENATAKFSESFEIAMTLGVDPRHADQMVRGTVSLPNGTGKNGSGCGLRKRGKSRRGARVWCRHRWCGRPDGDHSEWTDRF